MQAKGNNLLTTYLQLGYKKQKIIYLTFIIFLTKRHSCILYKRDMSIVFDWRIVISIKSELKKRFILKKSKEMFMEKGYQAVTMTDIVGICEISRGGLYRDYKNTMKKNILQDQFESAVKILSELIQYGIVRAGQYKFYE